MNDRANARAYARRLFAGVQGPLQSGVDIGLFTMG